MNSVRFSWRLLPFFVFLSLLIVSCQKNNNAPSSSQDETKTLLTAATNDIVEAANQESQDVDDIMGDDSSSSCRVVTFVPSRKVFPHQKIIDYGTGCKGIDGITRKGKKIVTLYADPLTSSAGTILSETTYSDFYVDDVHVTGEVKTYMDISSKPDARVIKNVVNKGLTSTNGDSKTFTATNYWKQVAGGNTAMHSDDVFAITGSADGNETLDGSTAIQWTAVVDELHPVIKAATCSYRTQGGLQIKLHILTGGGSHFDEYLDYGDGSCDNNATLSINGGIPQEVQLPLSFWPLSL